MGFGDVYTALQSKIIDGAENNEMALTDNGHGDVCKYYSYDMHQMVPDILIGNNAFMEGLSDEERASLMRLRPDKLCSAGGVGEAVAAAKERAENEQHVQFNYPDLEPFKEACMPLHQTVLAGNPSLQSTYDTIQAYNAQYPQTE